MYKEVKSGMFNYDGIDREFNFYLNLRASDKVAFVASVVDTVVGTHFNYVIKDIMFDFTIITTFTDIDVGEFVTGKLDEIEEFLENTTIVDIVKANVDEGLIDELRKAVDLDLQYKTGIKVNSFENGLVSLMSVLENQLKNINSEEMMDYIKRINGISGGLSAQNIVDEYFKSDAYKTHIAEAEAKDQKRMEIMRDIGLFMKQANK